VVDWAACATCLLGRQRVPVGTRTTWGGKVVGKGARAWVRGWVMPWRCAGGMDGCAVDSMSTIVVENLGAEARAGGRLTMDASSAAAWWSSAGQRCKL